MTFIQDGGRYSDVTFGERLRIARERAGLGQRELARKAGIKSEGQVQQYEAGEIKEPSGSRTARLAAALNIRHEWLTLEEGEMFESEARAPLGPFEQARELFFAGVANRTHAEEWMSSTAFRMPSTTNARELLEILETSYARYLRALDLADAGGTVREVGLALGGVGSRIDDAPDEEPRVLAPVKRRKPR